MGGGRCRLNYQTEGVVQAELSDWGIVQAELSDCRVVQAELSD